MVYQKQIEKNILRHTIIYNLNESLRNEVKLKMERNLNFMYKQKKEVRVKTLKERIKNKLKVLIDKI